MTPLETRSFLQFKDYMERIAKINQDEFQSTMTVTEKGYRLQVIETADKHVFVDVRGTSVLDAITLAIAETGDALKAWSYKDVPPDQIQRYKI